MTHHRPAIADVFPELATLLDATLNFDAITGPAIFGI
ncbi:hypothetical protein R69746_08171 [Paraburkholderia aspalathi]|nr:hypothetical protein R75465_07676 [Paraburkholderia aspalathi]CAE6867240.1 hypothetical protein R69746_08171 [Paraburkholderia aspalathi]